MQHQARRKQNGTGKRRPPYKLETRKISKRDGQEGTTRRGPKGTCPSARNGLQIFSKGAAPKECRIWLLAPSSMAQLPDKSWVKVEKSTYFGTQAKPLKTNGKGAIAVRSHKPDALSHGLNGGLSDTSSARLTLKIIGCATTKTQLRVRCGRKAEEHPHSRTKRSIARVDPAKWQKWSQSKRIYFQGMERSVDSTLWGTGTSSSVAAAKIHLYFHLFFLKIISLCLTYIKNVHIHIIRGTYVQNQDTFFEPKFVQWFTSKTNHTRDIEFIMNPGASMHLMSKSELTREEQDTILKIKGVNKQTYRKWNDYYIRRSLFLRSWTRYRYGASFEGIANGTSTWKTVPRTPSHIRVER